MTANIFSRIALACLLAAGIGSGCAVREHQDIVDESSAMRARDALYNAATRYEYPAAIEALQAVVDQSPQDATSRLALVYGHLKRGQYDKARPHVAHLQTNPAALNTKERLWLAAFEAKVADRPVETVDRWRSVVRAFPDDRWGWYELATASANLEDYTVAASAAAQALRIESDPAKWEASWIYYLRSKALFRSGKYDAAVAAARAGKDNASTWRSTYFRMAIAQIASGDQQVAASFVDNYRAISAREGRNNESYTQANIALFYYELGEYDLAVKYAQKAHQLDAASYPTWALSYCLAEAGDMAQALDVIDAAANKFPDDPHVAAAHGWALFRAGQLAQAVEVLKAAAGKSSRDIFYILQMRETIERVLAEDTRIDSVAAPWLG